MLELEGEIGMLSQNGEQVGGVFDWHSRLALDYTVKNNAREYKPTKHIMARSYWLIYPIRDNTFDAEFYQVINGDLVLMEAGKVAIDLPDTETIDRRMYAPVGIKWISYEY